MNQKYTKVPSAIEFDFDEDDVCRILEAHVRQLMTSSNADLSTVSAHHDKEGSFFVAVWGRGVSRVSTIGTVKE